MQLMLEKNFCGWGEKVLDYSEKDEVLTKYLILNLLKMLKVKELQNLHL